jgi:SAM-dependent methyltransferase
MTVSDFYTDYWSDTGFAPPGVRQPELEEAFRRFVTPDKRAIDVGCGDGIRGGSYLREHGRRYVGVDIGPGAIERARANGFDARQIETAEKLPFDDASFDLVCCSEVLEHLLRPDLAVREMARVLAPGGVMILTVPNVAYWRWRLGMLIGGTWNPLGDDESLERPWRDPHIRFFTPTTLAAMLGECGLVDLEVTGHGGAPRRLPARSQALYDGLAERRFSSALAWTLRATARTPSGGGR